jgi:hypothetical protein
MLNGTTTETPARVKPPTRHALLTVSFIHTVSEHTVTHANVLLWHADGVGA